MSTLILPPLLKLPGALELTPSEGVGAAPRAYRREVTVDNTGGAAKTGWAVRIDLTSSNFDFANADEDGADFRAGTEDAAYSYWIESWDSDAEAATVWVKVPSIAAGGSASFFIYYGNDGAASASNIYDTFIFGDDFTDIGRFRGLPDLTYAAQANSVGVVLGNASTSIITASAGTWKDTVREQSNIIYDPDDADPDRRYKVYFTGFSNASERKIGVAFSPDGYTWTEYGSNPIIAEGEDPYIMRNVDGSLYRDLAGKMHLYSEDQAQHDMLHYTSTDGVAWTADLANPVIARGGSYDSALVGSPIAIHLGGHSKYVMVYEGIDGSADDWTCLARATTPDGDSWTKEATNPIASIGVPDDLVLTDDGWVFIAHPTSAGPERWLSTDLDPDTWDSSSFSAFGPNPLTSLVPSSGYNFGGAADGTFGERVITQTSARTAFDMFDVLGTDLWRFERFDSLLANATAYASTFAVASPAGLVIAPNVLAGNSAMVAYTEGLSLTSNFAVMFRRKQEESSEGDCGAMFSIGSGGPATNMSAGVQRATFTDGYQFITSDPGAANSLAIREYAAGLQTATLGQVVISTTEANNFAVHEVRYQSSGAMAYLIDGVSKFGAVSDSTWVASAKNIMFGVSNTGSLPAAITTHLWVAVRPYDGVDPTPTVGSEEAL